MFDKRLPGLPEPDSGPSAPQKAYMSVFVTIMSIN